MQKIKKEEKTMNPKTITIAIEIAIAIIGVILKHQTTKK